MLNASDDLHCDPSGNLIAVRESDVIVGLLQLPGRLLGPFDHGRWAGPRGVSVRDAFLSRTTDLKSVALSISNLLARFLTARNCMSLILKMKTGAENGLSGKGATSAGF
jgi:hypothetical protein